LPPIPTGFSVESWKLNPETRAVHWQKVTLVGVGLLGGSLGQALKARRLAGVVAGFVRRAASVAECESLGAVDQATLELERAVEGADLIVLCTPIAQMRPLVAQMAPALKRGVIVTDVGSVKGSVMRDLGTLVAKAGGHFVGSHPMAGAEKMGVAAARADLFAGAVCVVTPTRKSNRAALRKVEQLWQSVGSRVVRLSPAVHDELVSRSSHLPHLVAAGLANFILSPKHPEEQALLCANGFRDTTRIASGSPEMWRDIAVANRKDLGRTLAVFIAELERIRRMIAKGEPRAIERFLGEAKARRDEWQRDATAASSE
jgi:prephenate dehydrogenase